MGAYTTKSNQHKRKYLMKAAVITEPGGPDVLKIMEVADPIPGPDDILIDV